MKKQNDWKLISCILFHLECDTDAESDTGFDSDQSEAEQSDAEPEEPSTSTGNRHKKGGCSVGMKDVFQLMAGEKSAKDTPVIALSKALSASTPLRIHQVAWITRWTTNCISDMSYNTSGITYWHGTAVLDYTMGSKHGFSTSYNKAETEPCSYCKRQLMFFFIIALEFQCQFWMLESDIWIFISCTGRIIVHS